MNKLKKKQQKKTSSGFDLKQLGKYHSGFFIPFQNCDGIRAFNSATTLPLWKAWRNAARYCEGHTPSLIWSHPRAGQQQEAWGISPRSAPSAATMGAAARRLGKVWQPKSIQGSVSVQGAHTVTGRGSSKDMKGRGICFGLQMSQNTGIEPRQCVRKGRKNIPPKVMMSKMISLGTSLFNQRWTEEEKKNHFSICNFTDSFYYFFIFCKSEEHFLDRGSFMTSPAPRQSVVLVTYVWSAPHPLSPLFLLPKPTQKGPPPLLCLQMPCFQKKGWVAAACVPVAPLPLSVWKSLGIFYNLMRKWIFRGQGAVKVGPDPPS